MQWNSPLVLNGMPQSTINSSHSSTGNWVSSLHDWLLLANAINYSQLSQLIALCNLTNSTSWRFEETCCHSNSSEKPSANADVKNSKGVIIIIIITTNCNWYTWNDLHRLGKGARRVGNQRTIRDHSDYCSVKIGLNTNKSPSDLRKVSLHRLQWKTVS